MPDHAPRLALLLFAVAIAASPLAAQTQLLVQKGIEIKADNSRIASVAISSKGTNTVTAAGSSIKLWDADTGKSIRVMLNKQPLVAMAYSPDEKWIASADKNGSFIVWVVENGKPYFESVGKGQPCRALAYSPDGKWVAVSESNNTITLYSSQSWLDENFRGSRILKDTREPAHNVVFSSDSSKLAASCYNTTATGDRDTSTVYVWNVESSRLERSVVTKGGGMPILAFTTNGKSIASLIGGGDVNFLDISSGEWTRRFNGTSDSITAIAFNPNGQSLGGMVTAGSNGVYVWNTARGETAFVMTEHKGEASCLAISKDGNSFVTGCRDGRAITWKLRYL